MTSAPVGIEYEDLHRVHEADGSALWAAVIFQAIRDATHTGVDSQLDPNRKRDARDWLTKYDRDFETVCHFAGFAPEGVRSAAVKLIEQSDENPETFKLNYRPANRGRTMKVQHAEA